MHLYLVSKSGGPRMSGFATKRSYFPEPGNALGYKDQNKYQVIQSDLFIP